jgi:WD40 repeat protein
MFSPNGELLATTNDRESKVMFWNPSSGDQLFTLSDPSWLDIGLVPVGIAFNSDGTLLAISLHSSGLWLGSVEIWDVKLREKVQTLGEPFDAFGFPAFSPDGMHLAMPFGPEGIAAVWEVKSGKLLFSLRESVNAISYSADGKRLLAASGGGRVKVLDSETGEELLTLMGHTGRVYKLAESPECVKPPAEAFEWCGRQLATAGDDGTVRVWDVSPAGNQELLTLPGSNFALNADGTQLSTIIYDFEGQSVVQQWELSTGGPTIQISGYNLSSIPLEEGFRQFWFFRQQGILARAFDNGPLKFWDVTRGEEALASISCCEWTPGMVLSVSSGTEPRVAIGDSQTGTVKIWDLAADENTQTFQVAEPNELVSSEHSSHPIVLSPNGEHLAILKNDASVETWNVKTGQRLLSLPGPSVLDSAALFYSPDGKWLVISDCTGTLVVRDAVTGTEKRRFSSGAACILDIAFSPDGKQIAASGGRRDLKIWDFETGRELLTLPGAIAVQFTPDGTRLIAVRREETALFGDTVRVYPLELEDLVALAKSRLARSLTAEECKQYLHMEQCPLLPAP